jgi:NO-binding membrane sensor protein with MHYT domain
VQVDHFTFGAVTPVLSYALSVLGSLLGLICTVRARAATQNGSRARWLLLAAWAIGGTGIWVMHFMAMLGFSAGDQPIRYDVSITVASWITAIVSVGIGLFIVGFGRPRPHKIIAGGLFTGVGVAAMHYTGMAAMRMPADVSYDRTLVIASVAIAVVAATVALWFTVTLRRGVVLFIAALIMGVAVNGMHFTGMFAMRVSEFRDKPVTGILPVTFIAPIALFVILVIVVLLTALINRTGTDYGDRGAGDPTVRMVDLTGVSPHQHTASGRRGPGAFVPRPTR